MANTRYVTTSFWEDSKIQDIATPEDRYFMLYLLTNPHTTQSGCYEVTKKTISFETGYSIDIVDKLLNRMTNQLNFIIYDENTHEILINNWYKYNWTTSPKVKSYLLKEITNIKSKKLLEIVSEKLKNVYGIDTLCIPYRYPIDTPSQNKIKENKIKENKIKVEEIKKQEIPLEDEDFEENPIYEMFEQEFGRTISPIEYEIIAQMINNYSVEFIKLALSEAVANGAVSFKYIEKILFNWKKKNLKTVEEVKKSIEDFHNKTENKSCEKEYYKKLDE